MEIEEDMTVRKPSVIVERKLTFNKETNNWTWSSPKKYKYKKPISEEHLNVIKNLLESKDLHEINITSIIRKCENMVYKKPVIDNKFWETPGPIIGEMYLVPPEKGQKWCTAKLVAIDGEVLHLVTLKTMSPETLNQKLVAVGEPVKEFLKVGSRVVGLVHKMASTGEMFRGKRVHMLGVVAEFPNEKNKYRYLLILDNGWWTYVQYTCIWPVCTQPPEIWKHIPKDVQPVVQNYLEGLYLNMVDYQKGDTIRCIIDDIDLGDGLVLQVDCSIVIFWSPKYSNAISLHRGIPYFKKV